MIRNWRGMAGPTGRLRRDAGEPGRGLANGDVLRIEATTANGIQVRRMLDPDPATGARHFASHASGPRLPRIGPGLCDHRPFSARRHRAHRDRAGHRQRNPAMAVLGAGPRHREQHGVRLHDTAKGRRTRCPAPARHRSWNATNASAASAKASRQPGRDTDPPAKTRASLLARWAHLGPPLAPSQAPES